ncbi:MAG: Flp pilus assembly complex ATPase component TadA [Thermoleophilia bacterium]|nr:Flp pilus assembly complex ATPase component TadA [Thermoleophilia bacterium]
METLKPLRVPSGERPDTVVPHAQSRVRLGTMLVRAGLLTNEQVQDALAEKAETGKRLGEIIVERGWVSSRDLARALAEQHGLEFVDLADTEIEDSAANLLPERLARRYRAVPLKFLAEDSVLVAVADPTDVITSDDLRLALGLNVRFAVVDGEDLERTLTRSYRLDLSVGDDMSQADHEENEVTDVREIAATSAPAIKLVNSVLSHAIEESASDVHFEPELHELVVRARIDGVTRVLTTIPKAMQPAVVSRLKIMGELDIAERRLPQDGRVSIRFAQQPMDLRMAVLPTTHGEKVILRIAGTAGKALSLGELGMSPEAEQAFQRAIEQPYGAVITCGPTGSGKTTTLYAALQMLNDPGRVLTTIEDPVEYQFPGISQIEVNPKSGLTFARGLRTILRSDPDVLLVGEVRDEETARIAVQAALTGHLVLTTLHAHTAASSIARLKDMGVEPNLLATSVNCIVAQRLARRLCADCRRPYDPTPQELEELHGIGMGTLYRAGGCARCANTGFRGRVALYEVMPFQGEVRRLVERSTEEIFAAAVEQGMHTLREDGLRLCLAGVTSLEEVRRVTGDRLA